MSEGAWFCGHCDKPITSGQKYRTYAKVSISAGGVAVRLHERCAGRVGLGGAEPA
ncbi:hypothetical protein [Streptomyces sp. NPDC047123]|uniref:hypothetical protein n=1 Tax=Streptomyces sp. NPDC047123 TaxID=3155622 RepID=UPI0033F969B8